MTARRGVAGGDWSGLKLVTNQCGPAPRATYDHAILALREELRRLKAVVEEVAHDRTLTWEDRSRLTIRMTVEIRETSMALVALQREAAS